MQKLLARLVDWRLQYVLVLGLALTTAITILVGTPVTCSVINSYLGDASDARIGRDMDLANAFYNGKLQDISSIDTPKAAPKPFDPREGTARLALMGAAPILSEKGQLLDSVLVGHLFNRDYTLVDCIKEVAGVDTATIFLGDLRVSAKGSSVVLQ